MPGEYTPFFFVPKNQLLRISRREHSWLK
jgi:hypothetical protein